MERIWRRRGALFTLTFVYTGFAAAFLTSTVRTVILLIAAVFTAASFLLIRIPSVQKHLPVHAVRVFRLVLCAGMVSLLVFSIHHAYACQRPAEKWAGTTADITATVLDKQYTTAYETAYTADAVIADGDKVRILLVMPSDVLTYGDVVACTVKFSAFAEHSGTFPEERYYYSMGTVLRGDTDSAVFLRASTTLRIRIGSFRDSLLGILRADLGRADSALACALFLGDRSDLPDSLTRDFRRLGISHLLAISGMHFTVLLSSLGSCLNFFVPSRKMRSFLLMLAAVFYMFLCGLTESVVRAGIMMLISYAALFFARRSDMITSLGASAFLMCALDPSAFYSVALQLSVTAVAALFAAQRIEAKFRTEEPPSRSRAILREIISAFLLPISVQIILMPLLCLYFGEISLLTPVATVLFSPIVDWILKLTPLFLLLRPLAPLADAVGFLLAQLSAIAADLAEALASLHGISVSLRYSFAPLYTAALSALLLSTPLCKNKKSLRRHLSATICVLLLFSSSIVITEAVTRHDVTVVSAANGKNDALIVHTGKEYMLIDISDGSYSALMTAYSSAAQARATEIDALFLTHLHNRHINGIARLCGAIYVRSLILPEPQTDTEIKVAAALTAFCESEGIPLYTYTPDDVISMGERVEILPEKREYLSRSTHPIVTLTIRANGASFSYFGAARSEFDISAVSCTSDVIVFGGHGPIAKQDIRAEFTKNLRTAVIRPAAGALSEQTRQNLPADAILLADGEPHVFVFSP